MTTAVLYHDNCPDGWTAAWVAHHALKHTGPPDLIPVTHGNPPPYGQIEDVQDLFIVDFSYDAVQLKALADGGRRDVFVLDHHQTAIDDLVGPGHDGGTWAAGTAAAFLDTNRSGAGLAWDHFHPGQRRPDIVDYVEDRDLWRFNLPGSQEINAYLRTVPHTLDDWDGIQAGWNTAELTNIGAGALSHIEAYCRAAANHAYWANMGDRHFPIVNVTYESCSEVASHLLDHFDADMAGYYFERGDGGWQYGFRSRNGTTVHDHAAAFGGGGHPQASGCVLDEIGHERAIR